MASLNEIYNCTYYHRPKKKRYNCGRLVDYEVMPDKDEHRDVISNLKHALEYWFKDSTGVYVVSDMAVYCHFPHVRISVTPDLMVCMNAGDKHRRDSWIAGDEGESVPEFVLEVISNPTRSFDHGKKRDKYRDIGVLEYWRFDPTPRRSEPKGHLIGDKLEDGQYVPIDEDHSKLLGLDFVITNDPLSTYRQRPHKLLRLSDPITGKMLETPMEANSRADAAEARADDERRRRITAETENAKLRAELERLKAHG